MATGTAGKIASGLSWTVAEKICTVGVQFVVGIVLARLLTPAIFGLVGIVTVFINIATTICEGGFRIALIRKPDLTEADCSTAFYFNLVGSAVLCGLLALFAPFIASFFDDELLASVLRAYTLILLLNATIIVQDAQLSRQFEFRKLAIITVVSTLVSAVVGIVCAYNGFEVWSLVMQQGVAALLRAVLFWVLSSWRPTLVFSMQSFKELFGYGSKLLVSGIINTIVTEATTMVIGKFYKKSQLGYYSRASLFSSLIPSVVMSAVGKVIVPAMSEVQSDKERLKDVYRTMIRAISIPLVFVMLALTVFAEDIVLITIGEEWLPCVQYFRLLPIAYLTEQVTVVNLTLLQVVGRSDLFLRLEVIKKSIYMLLLILVARYGIIAICLFRVGYSYIAVGINSYYSRGLLGVTVMDQLRDFVPYIAKAVLALVPAVLLTQLTDWNSFVTLIVGGAMSAVAYYFILGNDRVKYMILDQVKQRCSAVQPWVK